MGEVLRQRANMTLVVETVGQTPGNAFWQLIRAKNDNGLYFLLLMDSHALSPSDRRVALKLGGGDGSTRMYTVFDQFGSQDTPLGKLDADTGHSVGTVLVDIPAGSARFLTLRAADAPVVYV